MKRPWRCWWRGHLPPKPWQRWVLRGGVLSEYACRSCDARWQEWRPVPIRPRREHAWLSFARKRVHEDDPPEGD